MTALAVLRGEPIFTGEVHPLADMWPMLGDDDLAALAADIEEHGLRQPIVIDASGRLVDGRNRLQACDMADVEPAFECHPDLDSDEAVAAFIGSANAERRHLSTGQQAMGRALMLAAQGKRKDGRWVRGAIHESVNSATERNLLSQCGLVLDWTPENAQLVLSGEWALDHAYRSAKDLHDKATQAERDRKAQAAARAEREKLETARLADLRESRPDLADLVDTRRLQLVDALTIRDKELAAERKRVADEAAARAKHNADVNFAIHCLAGLTCSDQRIRQTLTEVDLDHGKLPITFELLDEVERSVRLLRDKLMGATA